MIIHNSIDNKILLRKIRSSEIVLGGNKKLKIYGQLNCSSGIRMKKENGVFFSSEEEGLSNGFRPCGHCMIDKYRNLKKSVLNKVRKSYSGL